MVDDDDDVGVVVVVLSSTSDPVLAREIYPGRVTVFLCHFSRLSDSSLAGGRKLTTIPQLLYTRRMLRKHRRTISRGGRFLAEFDPRELVVANVAHVVRESRVSL